MIELPNSIRRRLEVLTAVGLATVSAPAAANGASDERASTDETGGERRGR